jgi:hypothetical protein
MLVQQVSPVLVHLILDDTLRYKAMAFLKIIAEACKSNHHFQYVWHGFCRASAAVFSCLFLCRLKCTCTCSDVSCSSGLGVDPQTNGTRIAVEQENCWFVAILQELRPDIAKGIRPRRGHLQFQVHCGRHEHFDGHLHVRDGRCPGFVWHGGGRENLPAL